jgi:hypothetical protein
LFLLWEVLVNWRPGEFVCVSFIVKETWISEYMGYVNQII